MPKHLTHRLNRHPVSQGNSSRERIPLLPQALKIMDAYKDHPQCVNEDKLLPDVLVHLAFNFGCMYAITVHLDSLSDSD